MGICAGIFVGYAVDYVKANIDDDRTLFLIAIVCSFLIAFPISQIGYAVDNALMIGSIVFVSKDAEADLNGFKLFPQYKKYTYTVEAYDAISDVYTLRRLNLSLRLKEAFILAPDEKAHDPLNRKQF